jgi:hypothetical protein
MIQSDSKLLSGFSWPIIFKPKQQNKNAYGIENVTQKVSYGNAVFAAINVWEKI